MGTATLTLTAVRKADGATINISAANGDGTVGKGTVRLAATSGTLDTASATLDAYGTASVWLACDPAMDPACMSNRVIGTWTPANAKEPIEEQVRITYSTLPGADAGTTITGPEFDGGLRLIANECAVTEVPALNPQCCRATSSNMYGLQAPKCPAYQVEPGGSLVATFDGFMGISTTPFATNVPFTLSLDMPTQINSPAECSIPKGLQVDANGLRNLGGHLIIGRITSQFWIAIIDGGGSTGMVGPQLEVCNIPGGVPQRSGFYVVAESLSFDRGDGTRWVLSPSDGRRFFWTVKLY